MHILVCCRKAGIARNKAEISFEGASMLRAYIRLVVLRWLEFCLTIIFIPRFLTPSITTMGRKKGKNTNTGTNKAAPPPAILCIRCPDVKNAKDNKHQNNFATCSNKYPTQPTANTPAQKSANDLWWPFAEGGNNFTFATTEDCDQLLDFAKQAVAGNEEIQPHVMDSVFDIKDRESKREKFKEKAKYDDKQITKGSLEAALIKKAELKREKKEGRRQDHEVRVQREAALAEEAAKVESQAQEEFERQKAVLAEEMEALHLQARERLEQRKAASAEKTAKLDSQDQEKLGQPPVALAQGTGKVTPSATSSNAQAPFVNPPNECLRCPRFCRDKAAEHYQNRRGLVACQLHDFNVANRWNPQDLWPSITINYNDLDKEEKRSQMKLNALLLGADPLNEDGVREVFNALKKGDTSGTFTFGPLRFTKKIAEDVVTAFAQPDSIAQAGAGTEDVSSSGEADTGNGTSGVGSQPAAPSVGVAGPSVGVAGPSVGVAPPSQPSAPRNSQAQHYTKNELGRRTEFASNAPKPNIRTNFLTMTWPTKMHVYSVEMVRSYLQNNAPVLVKRQADKLSVMDVIRTQSLPQHLSHKGANGVPRSDYWVTDGDLIWSTKPLFHATDETAEPPDLSTSNNTEVQYINEMGDQLTVELVRISYLRTLDLNENIVELFYDSSAPSWDDGNPGLISRGLNLFFTRFARENANNTTTTLNKSFINENLKALDSARVLPTIFAMRGFFLSVRPGVERLYLNINRSTSPFIEADLTVQQMMNRLVQQQGRSEGEARAVLKGLKVRIIYDKVVNFATDQQRIRIINCIGKKSNNGSVLSRINQVDANPTFQTHGHQTVTVHDWYTPPQFQNDPDAPSPALTLTGNEYAVNVGKDPRRDRDNVWWIPATQLRIEPWQKFQGRLTSEQTTNMLAAALMQPAAHKNEILGTNYKGGLHHFGFSGNVAAGPDGRQGLLKTNEMSAGTDFIKIPGSVLPAPGLIYSHEQIKRAGQYRLKDPAAERLMSAMQPNDAKWNLRNCGFATIGRILAQIPVLDISGNFDYNLNQHFEGTIRQQFGMHGLITNPWVPFIYNEQSLGRSGMDRTWENNFKNALQTIGAQCATPDTPVMVNMRGHGQDDYACIKRVADLELGMHTVCVANDKVLVGRKSWSLDTVSNIALKYKVKDSKGRNHHFSEADLDVLNKIGGTGTIVVGADCAHPMKGAHTATPSIAAVVGSTDNGFMHYPGSMRLQPSRKEDILELSEMLKERLLDWAFANQKAAEDPLVLPSNILFYRDGVSESQYDILRRRELPQVQIAYNKASRYLQDNYPQPGATMPPGPMSPPDFSGVDWQGSSRQHRVTMEKDADEKWAAQIAAQPNNVPFKLTYVVVGKRHNTRFYPDAKEVQGNKGNVKPGLVVDQVITHPYSMDFYLQSHEAIQGTARSAHYFTLQNNMGLSADNLHIITHMLCYAYARATKGVSYCAPAYYADKLCDRGRAYLRHYYMNVPGFEPRALRRAAGGRPLETYEQYIRDIRDSVHDSPNYRPYLNLAPQQRPQQNGVLRQNPWHPNLDNTMFYL
ncbi:hypothetical protein D0863_04911 [Hortaea werneckii]|uniref:Piwi domain-containing protein n=1 Tax=Hortaea werneckii TaxID=91943 RepID=A0A3M7E6I0_HORWE|nr:hypothetical protein D0863_04911 [Hortaea werneckii]